MGQSHGLPQQDSPFPDFSAAERTRPHSQAPRCKGGKREFHPYLWKWVADSANQNTGTGSDVIKSANEMQPRTMAEMAGRRDGPQGGLGMN